MRRHGAISIILSRLIPVVRTLMPAVAGVAKLPYRTFLLASVIGSAVWSIVWVAAGLLLAELVRTHAGTVAALTSAAALGALIMAARRRRSRTTVSPARATPAIEIHTATGCA